MDSGKQPEVRQFGMHPMKPAPFTGAGFNNFYYVYFILEAKINCSKADTILGV
jgi:hypothetical protein